MPQRAATWQTAGPLPALTLARHHGGPGRLVLSTRLSHPHPWRALEREGGWEGERAGVGMEGGGGGERERESNGWSD